MANNEEVNISLSEQDPDEVIISLGLHETSQSLVPRPSRRRYDQPLLVHNIC